MQERFFIAGLMIVFLCPAGSRAIEPSPTYEEVTRQIHELPGMRHESKLVGTFRYLAGEDCAPGAGDCEGGGGLAKLTCGGEVEEVRPKYEEVSFEKLSFLWRDSEGVAPARAGSEAVAKESQIPRFPLDNLGLSWLRSATWVESRSTVVLTDSIGKRVVEIELSEDGVPRKRLSTSQLHPSYIATNGNGYLQMEVSYGIPQDIRWFGPDLTPKGETKLLRPKNMQTAGWRRGPTENAVVAFYSWIVAGDRIFAYGVLDDGSKPTTTREPYRYGFFTYKLRAPQSRAGFPKADLLETFDEAEYYTIGAPYIVAVGSEVYYMEMGVNPALKYFDIQEGGKPVYLDGLPGFSEALPRLDANRPVALVYDEIERLSMPAGLYADPQHGEALYLLDRKPENGATRWTMTKLKPEPGNRAVKKVGAVRLPTTAPHLTVLFTPKQVLLFEKSSVDGSLPPREQRQDVTAMLVLPKFWVTDPGPDGTSPLED